MKQRNANDASGGFVEAAGMTDLDELSADAMYDRLES